MKIKLIYPKNDHLTAREKKAIVTLFNISDFTLEQRYQIGRKGYRISAFGSDYKVLITENASNDYGGYYLRSNVVHFSIIK